MRRRETQYVSYSLQTLVFRGSREGTRGEGNKAAALEAIQPGEPFLDLNIESRRLSPGMY